ncbi:MAG: SdrD B-like domain-containing protein, partial [Cyanobacteria bacterium P01_H01_bin.15]
MITIGGPSVKNWVDDSNGVVVSVDATPAGQGLPEGQERKTFTYDGITGAPGAEDDFGANDEQLLPLFDALTRDNVTRTIADRPPGGFGLGVAQIPPFAQPQDPKDFAPFLDGDNEDELEFFRDLNNGDGEGDILGVNLNDFYTLVSADFSYFYGDENTGEQEQVYVSLIVVDEGGSEISREKFLITSNNQETFRANEPGFWEFVATEDIDDVIFNRIEFEGAPKTTIDGQSDSSDLLIESLTLNPVVGGDNTAGLGDRVWSDENHNGLQDDPTLEPGVEGVTVTLIGAGLDNTFGTSDDISLATTTTDSDGKYFFSNLQAGQYKVLFSDIPEGSGIFSNNTLNPVQGFSGFTDPNSGDDTLDSDADPTTGLTDVIDLEEGEVDDTIDAGLTPLPGLGDFVFEDVNGDGIQDAGDSFVEGVVVTLTGAGEDGQFGTADDISATTTTDDRGEYFFANLTPGDYKVTFDLPNGFVFTSANQGDDDALDSDADPTTGMTEVVTITEKSGFNDTLDAGLVEENKGIDIEKFVNGIDVTDLEKLPGIEAGADVVFTYKVKNTGNVAFDEDEVSVVDDNGTPGDSSDDFVPTLDPSSDVGSDG